MRTNPTRRKGPRTGAIPVPKALVDKIVRAIFARPEVVHTFGTLAPISAEERLLNAIVGERPTELVTFTPLIIPGTHVKLWHFSLYFRIRSYVTGKEEELEVTIRDMKRDKFSSYESGVSGWQQSATGEIVELPKATRRERVRKALVLLGVDPTPTMIKKVFSADPTIALYGDLAGQRVAQVSVAFEFNVPAKRQWAEEYVRNTLVHEIAHVLDEGAKLRQMRAMREGGKDTVLADDFMDAQDIADLLDLPPPPEPRVSLDPRRTSKKHFTPTTAYFERPSETTAHIVEIFDQVDRRVRDLKYYLRLNQSFEDRGPSLVRALRKVSSTFRYMEQKWDARSLNRVLRAVYDRYHREKWFPPPTGVLKNRRTSRRRTSRRAG